MTTRLASPDVSAVPSGLVLAGVAVYVSVMTYLLFEPTVQLS